MTKTITTILVALFAAACGGEPFTQATFDAVGWEPLAGAAGAEDAAGGQPSALAGSPSGGALVTAGSGAGGTVSPSAGTVTGGTGGSANQECVFSAERLTQALPELFVWDSFSVASGSICASCTYEPCARLSTHWGEPSVLEQRVVYRPTYTSVATVPPMVRVAKNDNACSGSVQCEVKPESVVVGFEMARKNDGWSPEVVAVTVTLAPNDCTQSIGDPEDLSGPVTKDLQQEIRAALVGLKIPCD